MRSIVSIVLCSSPVVYLHSNVYPYLWLPKSCGCFETVVVFSILVGMLSRSPTFKFVYDAGPRNVNALRSGQHQYQTATLKVAPVLVGSPIQRLKYGPLDLRVRGAFHYRSACTLSPFQRNPPNARCPNESMKALMLGHEFVEYLQSM